MLKGLCGILRSFLMDFLRRKLRAYDKEFKYKALNFLPRVGVDYVVFEDLFLVKKRKFTRV